MSLRFRKQSKMSKMLCICFEKKTYYIVKNRKRKEILSKFFSFFYTFLKANQTIHKRGRMDNISSNMFTKPIWQNSGSKNILWFNRFVHIVTFQQLYHKLFFNWRYERPFCFSKVFFSYFIYIFFVVFTYYSIIREIYKQVSVIILTFEIFC